MAVYKSARHLNVVMQNPGYFIFLIFMSRIKKLKPYHTKGKKGKFVAEIKGDRKYATKAAREEARNANRSLKKSARQEGKREIRKNLYNDEE